MLDAMPLLSIVVPVYNEQATLETLVARLLEPDYGCGFEIVAIDDGSTDGSRELLARLDAKHPELRALYQERNAGKGAAVRRGFAESSGDIVVVQDADLEYDPLELPRLIGLIRRDIADVVYGSRFQNAGPRRVQYYWHERLNRMLTGLSNWLTDLDLTDMEVCYKAFRREVLDSIELRENRFGFEPEITAKIARRGWRIYEVPVSYYGRTWEEGKKLRWRDGLRAFWCILKYNLWSRR
jgi:glycosyltransferase involved in cell wall biosynthesis